MTVVGHTMLLYCLDVGIGNESFTSNMVKPGIDTHDWTIYNSNTLSGMNPLTTASRTWQQMNQIHCRDVTIDPIEASSQCHGKLPSSFLPSRSIDRLAACCPDSPGESAIYYSQLGQTAVVSELESIGSYRSKSGQIGSTPGF